MSFMINSPFARVHPAPPLGWDEDEKERDATEEKHDRKFLERLEYAADYLLTDVLFGIVYDKREHEWHLLQDDKEFEEEVKQDLQETVDEKGERKELNDLTDATTNAWMLEWDLLYKDMALVYGKIRRALQDRIGQRTDEFIRDIPEMLMPVNRAYLTESEYEWVQGNPDFPMMSWLDPGDIDYFIQALFMVIQSDFEWVRFRFVAPFHAWAEDPRARERRHIHRYDIIDLFHCMVRELHHAVSEARMNPYAPDLRVSNPRLYRKVLEMCESDGRFPIRSHLLFLCHQRMLQHEEFITKAAAQLDTLPISRRRRNSVNNGRVTYPRPSASQKRFQSTPQKKPPVPVWLARSPSPERKWSVDTPPLDLDAYVAPHHSAARASPSRSSPLRPYANLFNVQEGKDAEEEDDSEKHPRLRSHFGSKNKRALDRLIKKDSSKFK